MLDEVQVFITTYNPSYAFNETLQVLIVQYAKVFLEDEGVMHLRQLRHLHVLDSRIRPDLYIDASSTQLPQQRLHGQLWYI